ncbi:hypothetical protein MMC27_005186 [Xylographa pallens]|nr:hypothetical protein [Xylographa pallens]
MASLTNGHTNGHAQFFTHDGQTGNIRFADIPSAIDIPVPGADIEEAVEVNLEDLPDDPTELCTLLENEAAAKNFWLVISLAYAKQHKFELAIEILNKGLAVLARAPPKEKIGLLSLLCWLFLYKSREAPRVVPDGVLVSEARTKDFYLQAATGALNEASRVNPSFPPLFLARGILSLLRASLQPPSKTLAPGAVEQSERVETLRQALKCFDDASRVSAGRNMMAMLGKGRTLFSLGRYADALECYQEVLAKMPDLRDPDPRIGIGCCLWQLSHREEAHGAWERALEINPDSKIANILVGLYYVHDSNRFSTTESGFLPIYKKAMTVYTQRAFKLDKEYPLTCATFGGYFLARQAWATVETLARKAIELTDVNAIASDGWYLLARKEHHAGPSGFPKAIEYYNRADNARGGGDRGFLPARFGAAQAQILNNDIDGAKFRLDKIIQFTKNIDAMVLLGSLYASEVFANLAAIVREDKTKEHLKATALLEAVRLAWKDSKKNIKPDTAVLICLSRLYEAEQPEKSLACLQQVYQMSLDKLPDEEKHQDIEDEDTRNARQKEHLAPQLLNNIGCFQFQMEKFDDAREAFQTGLTACIRLGEKEEDKDTDPLITTISYNLARTYEAIGLLEEAKQVYEGLLERHADYTDARSRLAYIELRQNPTVDGPKAMATLFETDAANLDVRALYGWYLSKAKRRAANIAEDQEQRHYKHTLQHYDKHDQYSLTGMGNLYLTTAREMRRDTEQDKDKRRKTYEKAVEFYLKALQLDPRNAYAAQGIGIAIVEDKKDFTAAVQIFSKIKDTVRDASVYVNLGHVYGELKQYSRAIESYEAALAKDRASDPQILACLGRAWLLKGKHEKSQSAMKSSLDYSQRALEIAPDQIHFQFNIAFVQIQLAQLLYSLPEAQRTLVEVEAAASGLDDAIDSFGEIAKAKNPPYPRHDLEQRANMGRNTMRKQLERAVQQQTEYEETNKTKLARARELREAELKRREDERLAAAHAVRAEKERLAIERQKLLESSRVLAERRADEERKKEEAEWTVDSEGEKVKRRRKGKGGGGGKRKKKGEDDSGDENGTDGDGVGGSGRKQRRGKSTTDGSGGDGSGDEKRAPRKKRRLARKPEKKMKSSELVVDSDSEGEGAVTVGTQPTGGDTGGAFDPDALSDVEMAEADNDEEEDTAVQQRHRQKTSRRIDDDDDDDEEEGDEAADDASQSNGKGNVFADGDDPPTVNDAVGAAGDSDAAEY